MNIINLRFFHEILDELIVVIKKIDCKVLPESDRLVINLVRKFHRNNFAIAKLIEEGLFEECFSLQRLSLEHFFNIFALIEDPSFIENFRNNTELNISKTAKELQKNTANLTVENAEKLMYLNEEFKKNPVDSMGYSIYNAAKKCPCEIADFYDSLYRVYSLEYAHSTYASATRSPTEKNADEIIKNAIDFLRILIAQIKSKYLKITKKE